MILYRGKIIKLLLSVICVTYFTVAFGVNQYPIQTAKLLSAYKSKLKKVDQTRKKFTKMAKQKAIVRLEKEKKRLTRAADLDRAIAARDLVRALRSSPEVPDIPEDDKKYNSGLIDAIKEYRQRTDKVADYYKENNKNIMDELVKVLKNEMVAMDRKGSISDALIIKDLLKKIQEPDFSLVNFRFAVKKASPKEKTERKEVKKIVEKPKNKLEEKIKNTSLALGNNILAEDIQSEKGLVYVCFAESISPDNKNVAALREKIENNLFISILSCSMTEKDFQLLLQKQVKYLLKNQQDHPELLKYCALLSYLKPNVKNDKNINSFIKKSGKPNNISAILKFDKNMFGGSKEAEDIRMQIDNTNAELIAELRNQAQQLQVRYPRNKDVKKLVTNLAQIKIITQQAIPKKVELKICNTCKGTGSIEKECPVCNGKKTKMCERCIGSGVLVSTVECPDCKGKGKNWLGMVCKKCKGKGKIRKKEPCPECHNSGSIKCPRCKGKGTITTQCTECHGKGKIN